MNTRRYSRTLAEAFPQDASYACAIEAPARSYPKHFWRCFIALSIVAVIVIGVQA
jgi:anti-sigma-K factor RskA